MTLETANQYIKPFTQDGVLKTPELSDDWTLDFYGYDKIRILSDKLNTSVILGTSIPAFFRRYIFSKKIILDGNKLLGEFAFTLYDLLNKEDFLEAQRLIEERELEEPIHNDELIEFGVYLDHNDVEQVYLGKFGYSSYYLHHFSNELNVKKKNNNRYMVRYTKDTNYENVIIKTAKKKFFSFVRLLSVIEIEELNRDLLEHFYDSYIFVKNGANRLNIYEEEYINKYLYDGLYRLDKNYVFNLSSYHHNLYVKIDFEKLKDDLLRDKVDLTLHKYILEDGPKYDSLRDFKEVKKIILFADYKYND